MYQAQASFLHLTASPYGIETQSTNHPFLKPRLGPRFSSIYQLAAATAADPMNEKYEAWRLLGLEGLAGQARSQRAKGSNPKLRAQTQAPKHPLHKA